MVSFDFQVQFFLENLCVNYALYFREWYKQYDFDKLAKAESNARERRRYMAFAYISEGKTFTEAAIAVRVKLRTLMNWVKRFRAQGLEGLKDQPVRGVKPFLPAKELSAFREAVLELQENRKGGRVRGRDILELMKTKYGLEPFLRTVYDTLKRAELVWITGRSIHAKAVLEAQDAFKKTSEIK